MSVGAIKVGLVGVGAIAQVAHLPAYNKIHGMDVVALSDVNVEKTNAIAERYGIKKVYRDYEDLIADPEINVIDVCTPNHIHYDVVMRAIEGGKDVICEKPLSLNSKETKSIVHAVRAQKRKLLVAFNNRFRLDSSIIKNRIERGELGKIKYLKTGWLKRMFSPNRRSWTLSPDQAGGGAFIDLGIHLIDICLWLLGYPEGKKVSSFVYTDRGEDSVEDGGVAVIETVSGVSIVVEISWGLFIKESYHYLNIYGSDGSAHLDPFSILGSKDGRIADKTPKISKSRENIFIESYRHEIEYFGEVLRGKAEPPRIDEQVILHEIIDAIYDSARKGTAIHLR